MPPLVSVVIANWNGRHYLERCLTSLAAQNYPTVEVIVVDNGSTDGSVAWLSEHYPAIQLIANVENRGFAAANNQGIALSRGAYVALLNNDAWAEPEWLASLVVAAEQGSRIGSVASLMLLADQPKVVDSAGICVDRAGISWDRGGGLSAAEGIELPTDVFGACAGAGLYRRQLLDELGGFDQDFFAYLEDVDLAWRARWLGWRTVYAATARVYHVHSGTGREGSAFKTYWLSRNKIQLLLKDYPGRYFWLFAPLILLYDSLSLLNSVVTQRNLSAWRGRLAGWGQARGALRKRRELRALKCVPAGDVFRLLAPAAAPWQVQRRFRHLIRAPAEAPPNS